ncbi:MAG: hypothetical protein B9S32_14115 [Verrucomicrobia bacterium Tous-C9LFEB]|nr:MAG: hypothetical protein B9S32_14115 [Verrucomicrobia bacterium Tous-C9LFEB]
MPTSHSDSVALELNNLDPAPTKQGENCMKTDSTTFNSPREILLRILYLVPIPLNLSVFFMPLLAVIYQRWDFLALAGVLYAATVYFRYLGEKYWEFERLDDLMNGINRTDASSLEGRKRAITDKDLDRLLLALENWDGNAASRPEALLEANSGHRHKAQDQRYWDN